MPTILYNQHKDVIRNILYANSIEEVITSHIHTHSIIALAKSVYYAYMIKMDIHTNRSCVSVNPVILDQFRTLLSCVKQEYMNGEGKEEENDEEKKEDKEEDDKAKTIDSDEDNNGEDSPLKCLCGLLSKAEESKQTVVCREWYAEETLPIIGMEDTRLREKTVNIVMTAVFNNTIDLDSTIHMLPMLEIHGFIYQRRGKLVIPYYGYEYAIVSMQHGSYRRGVRETKTPLKNNLHTDMQLRGKNQHLKVSGGKIHITGIRTKKTGEMCIDGIVNKIEKLRNILRDIRSYPDPDALYGMCLSINPLIEGSVEKPLVEYIRINRVSRGETYATFVDDMIYGSSVPSAERIHVTSYNIHNKVFYVNICFKVNLLKLVRMVVAKGNRAKYHTWNNTQSAGISIKLRCEGPPRYVTFKVNSNGGINIWSKDNQEESFDAFRDLVPMLIHAYKCPGDAKRQYERSTPRNNL